MLDVHISFKMTVHFDMKFEIQFEMMNDYVG